jgi:hypothetical protein
LHNVIRLSAWFEPPCPRGLRRLGSHTRALLRLGPADLSRFNSFTQNRQSIRIIGQPFELVVPVVAEA